MFCGHISLVSKIGFISNQDPRNVISSVFLDLSHPVVYIRVGLLVGDVVSDNDSVGTLVVAGGNCLKAFLASGVPNLELDLFAIDFDGLDFEIDTNSGHKVVSEHVISKSNKKRRLAYTRRSDEEHFEEIVAIK